MGSLGALGRVRTRHRPVGLRRAMRVATTARGQKAEKRRRALKRQQGASSRTVLVGAALDAMLQDWFAFAGPVCPEEVRARDCTFKQGQRCALGCTCPVQLRKLTAPLKRTAEAAYKAVREHARTEGWRVVECDRPRVGLRTALCVAGPAGAIGSFDLAVFDAQEQLLVCDASCCTGAEPSPSSVTRKTGAHRRVLLAARNASSAHDLGRANTVVWLVYSCQTAELTARVVSAEDLLAGQSAPGPKEARRVKRDESKASREDRLSLLPKVQVVGHKGKGWVTLASAARALSPGSGSEHARLHKLLNNDGASLRTKRDDPRATCCCLLTDVRRLCL
jgi:hypothetical protein